MPLAPHPPAGAPKRGDTGGLCPYAKDKSETEPNSPIRFLGRRDKPPLQPEIVANRSKTRALRGIGILIRQSFASASTYLCWVRANVPGNHPPHRAMGDAIATAALLVRQVETAGSIQHLLELSRQPALQRRVPFGKHRGRLWSEVPPDYLDWDARQDWDDPHLAHTIRSAREGRFLPPPVPAAPS